MTHISRIKAALEFLKDNQGFNVGGLFVSRTDNVIHVTGYTNFSFIENLNKRIAIKEMENTKAEFNDYIEALPEFKDFMKNKEIKYYLNLDYGKGSIPICSETNGVITWLCQISD
jgi:hypothetical protein